eukprot:Awhi_evm1s6380
MFNLLSSSLLYHSLFTGVFSMCLVLIPAKVIGQAKEKNEQTIKSNPKELMIYRICGLWVFFGALVSFYVSNILVATPLSFQQFVASALAFVHLIEAYVKGSTLGFGIKQAGNLHL